MSTDLARYLMGATPDVAQLLAALTMPAYLSAFDPVTGENTVTITGTQSFTNLVILCDPAQLATGVRVILLRTAGAPMILGRVRVPPF